MRQRKLVGDRVQCAVTGGAPTAPAVVDFMFEWLGAVVVEGYGTTETGSVISNGKMYDSARIKLLDCPELNYFTTDKPFPRGEAVVHTDQLISGYFGNEQLNAASFVVIDGVRYFKTGDIAERRADGSYHLIDRKTHIFKLAQGEFVAPERLEVVYLNCPFVQHIFIHGETTHRYDYTCLVRLPPRF